MSIATQITALTGKVSSLSDARDDIITAINSKGVTATGHGFEDFADDIEAISQEGTHSPVIAVSAAGVVSASCGGVTNTHTLSSADDADFVAGNIKKDVVLFGVTGTHQGQGTYQAKTVTPAVDAQVVIPDAGYDALSSVTVAGDEDLVAGNIKSGINLFGVTGTYSGEGATYQSKTVTPSAAGMTVSADVGYDALSSVVINGDADLVAGNIKKDVEIFGVTGTLEGKEAYQTKSVTPGTSSQTVTPDSGYGALSSVTVAGDADLIANNIKENVEIFGVTGVYTGEAGSGGLNYTETSNSTGTTFAITRTIGGYGYTYTETALGSGKCVAVSCTGSETSQSHAGSLIVAALSSNINRIDAVYGSSYVSGYISSNAGYVNIPYNYTGTVTVRGYIGSTMVSYNTVTITDIDKYTCVLVV